MRKEAKRKVLSRFRCHIAKRHLLIWYSLFKPELGHQIVNEDKYGKLRIVPSGAHSHSTSKGNERVRCGPTPLESRRIKLLRLRKVGRVVVRRMRRCHNLQVHIHTYSTYMMHACMHDNIIKTNSCHVNIN